MLKLTFNLAITFGLNCRKFCDSCPLLKLTLAKVIIDVLRDRFDITSKQL